MDAQTAREWVQQDLSQSDYCAADMDQFRVRIQRAKAIADGRVKTLDDRKDLPHSTDAELSSVIRRLHAAFMIEYEKAVDVLSKHYAGLADEPHSSWFVANASRELTRFGGGSEPLVRMEKILGAMDEMSILPWYEDSEGKLD